MMTMLHMCARRTAIKDLSSNDKYTVTYCSIYTDMVDDVTAALKSRKSKLTLKLSDGCIYDDCRSRPNSISRLKNYEKLHGSASLPQTPVSPETSAINKVSPNIRRVSLINKNPF